MSVEIEVDGGVRIEVDADRLPLNGNPNAKVLLVSTKAYSAQVTQVRPIVTFSTPVALAGVTGTDRCYVNRTITQARMRVSSAPTGSALTVVLQNFNGSTWVDVTTLTIAAGSVLEVFQDLSYAQIVGNLLRLNVTSIGSTSAATGVVVDVLVSV